MNAVKLVWKTVSGDFPKLVGKIHEIVQFVNNWKMKELCTVGVSVASSVATAVSCGFIAKGQRQRAAATAAVQEAAAAQVAAEEEEVSELGEVAQVAGQAPRPPPSPPSPPPPPVVVVVVLLS